MRAARAERQPAFSKIAHRTRSFRIGFGQAVYATQKRFEPGNEQLAAERNITSQPAKNGGFDSASAKQSLHAQFHKRLPFLRNDQAVHAFGKRGNPLFVQRMNHAQLQNGSGNTAASHCFAHNRTHFPA
ncbi:hypothetical protein SDC9_70065 [bioreactor metagenome]|uniref:Uncharacterized protein n=1 Tax=bioreactor metagenome TaxID=1076179 RepID=A0A644Y6M8_9ZZZZ